MVISSTHLCHSPHVSCKNLESCEDKELRYMVLLTMTIHRWSWSQCPMEALNKEIENIWLWKQFVYAYVYKCEFYVDLESSNGKISMWINKLTPGFTVISMQNSPLGVTPSTLCIKCRIYQWTTQGLGVRVSLHEFLFLQSHSNWNEEQKCR